MTTNKNKSDPPEASVVVASFSSAKALAKCLASLAVAAPAAEIIVATCLDEGEISDVKASYPSVLFIGLHDDPDEQSLLMLETRVFRLRSQGLKLAQGEIVAMIEDHCEVCADWLINMENAIKAGHHIVGGPVQCSVEPGLFEYALYLSEYAAMMPPFPIKPINYISAVNSAYTRRSLIACQHVWRDGFYDNEVHDALIALGATYQLVASSTVKTELPFSPRQAVIHLFSGAMRYGSQRVGQKWSIKRAVRMVATIFVPLVLMFRIFNIVRIRCPENLIKFMLSVPWLSVLLFAWGAGEFFGVLKGRDGLTHGKT